MDINTTIILGLCIVVFLVLLIMYYKDRSTDKKFARFEQVLTDSMQENFILKKELENLKESLELNTQNSAFYDEILILKKQIQNLQNSVDDMEISGFSELIDKEIEKKITPAVQSLKNIDALMRKNLQ